MSDDNYPSQFMQTRIGLSANTDAQFGFHPVTVCICVYMRTFAVVKFPLHVVSDVGSSCVLVSLRRLQFSPSSPTRSISRFIGWFLPKFHPSAADPTRRLEFQRTCLPPFPHFDFIQ